MILPPRRDHEPADGLAHEEGAGEVHGDRAVPGAGVEVLGRGEVDDPGAVHEDVDPPEGLDGPAGRRLRGGLVGDVAAEATAPPPSRARGPRRPRGRGRPRRPARPRRQNGGDGRTDARAAPVTRATLPSSRKVRSTSGSLSGSPSACVVVGVLTAAPDPGPPASAVPSRWIMPAPGWRRARATTKATTRSTSTRYSAFSRPNSVRRKPISGGPPRMASSR